MRLLRVRELIRESLEPLRHPGGRFGALRIAVILAVPAPATWALVDARFGAPGVLLALLVVFSTYYGGPLVGMLCVGQAVTTIYLVTHHGYPLPTVVTGQAVVGAVIGGAIAVFLGDRLIWRERRANERLRQSDEGFRRLLSASQTGLLLVDPETRRLEYANQVFCDVVGRPLEELLGADPTQLLHDRQGPTLDSPDLPRLLAGEIESIHGSTRAYLDDGREVHIDVVTLAVPGPDGKPRLLASIVDRTDVVLAEGTLRAQANALERAQEIGRTGSWIWDPQTRHTQWSLQARRIYGFSDDLAEGPSTLFTRLVDPEDMRRVDANTSTALETGSAEIEYWITTPDGEVRLVHDRAEVEYDDDGTPLRVVGIVRDMTEWRELEDRLRRAEKLEALGGLAGGIAHDFNNLLQVIHRHAELGLADRDGEAALEHLQALLEPTVTAGRLVRQLLDFARPRIESAEIVDLNEAAEGVQRMLPHLLDANVEIQVEVSPQPAPVLADPAGLEQVLLNLAVNAGDAMPNGGKLSISIAGHDDELILVVSDTGEGMSEETRARIFDPFFTTKDPGKGTGLGLATVMRIVNECGGRIEVESEVGAGTSFVVRLPRAELAELPESTPRHRPAVADPGTHGARLLVVEDDPLVRAVTITGLERAGFDVTPAEDGRQALAIVDAGARFDVVVTDLTMPHLSGAQLVEALSRRGLSPAVIFTSGYGLPASLPDWDGQVAFLEKPFTGATLVDAVQLVLTAAGVN